MIAILVACITAPAQTTQPAAVTTDDPTEAIKALREQLIDSFNKADVDRLLSHLDPDVVLTWQDTTVCRGPTEVRAYYDKMMSGPNRIVKDVKSNPQVTDRHIYGTGDDQWAVSWGQMNDTFHLMDGQSFTLNSKFTATIARRGEAWKVTSFHVSANLFENDILKYAVGKAGTMGAVIAGIVGLIVGFLVAWLLRRPRPAPAKA
jgi:ketosteroid isomerase-like protein